MRQIFGGARILPLAALLLNTALAHDPATTKLTWTREISRIFEKRCAGCHQPGGSAPMSLQTYEETRPWAVAIKEEVLRRSMPPWPAAKGFGDFTNDISLPQEEINRIAEWAEGGAPEGDKQYLRRAFAVPTWQPATAPSGRSRTLGGLLQTPATILAITGSGSGKVWAETPDQIRIPLIWWTGPKTPKVQQPLILRNPLTLPAGSRIIGGPVRTITR